MNNQRTLGILLFPCFETLDFFGPLEMFGQLPEEIKIILIAEHAGPVKSIQGQSVIADFSWETASHLNILLVPGGMGARKKVSNSPLLQWRKGRATS